jgi:predicted secreted protein
MDKSGVHYTKQNNPDTERQILHDFTHTWNLKSWTQEQQKTESSYQRLREDTSGGRGDVCKEYNISNRKNKL